MVKVIERKPRKVTCPNCKAKLEYTVEDIKTTVITDGLGGEDITKYIICPDCDTHVRA